jgi:hypothetical protein
MIELDVSNVALHALAGSIPAVDTEVLITQKEKTKWTIL